MKAVDKSQEQTRTVPLALLKTGEENVRKGNLLGIGGWRHIAVRPQQYLMLQDFQLTPWAGVRWLLKVEHQLSHHCSSPSYAIKAEVRMQKPNSCCRRLERTCTRVIRPLAIQRDLIFISVSCKPTPLPFSNQINQIDMDNQSCLMARVASSIGHSGALELFILSLCLDSKGKLR